MTAWMLPLFVAAMAVAPAAIGQDQEPKPVPKGSVQLAVNGCLKGRVFTATAPREEELPRQGPDVTGQHFRVAGKKDVMKLVKAHQAFGEFVPENAWKPENNAIPLHPGAAKYYRERGWLKDATQ